MSRWLNWLEKFTNVPRPNWKCPADLIENVPRLYWKCPAKFGFSILIIKTNNAVLGFWSEATGVLVCPGVGVIQLLKTTAGERGRDEPVGRRTQLEKSQRSDFFHWEDGRECAAAIRWLINLEDCQIQGGNLGQYRRVVCPPGGASQGKCKSIYWSFLKSHMHCLNLYCSSIRNMIDYIKIRW